jgi:hypothetical protein
LEHVSCDDDIAKMARTLDETELSAPADEAAQTAPAPAPATPGVTEARATMRTGEPADVAGVVDRNPGDRDAILGMSAGERGNAFTAELGETTAAERAPQPVSAEAQQLILDWWAKHRLVGASFYAGGEEIVHLYAEAWRNKMKAKQACITRAWEYVQLYDQAGFKSPQVEQLRFISQQNNDWPSYVWIDVRNEDSYRVDGFGDPAQMQYEVELEASRRKHPEPW